MTVRDGNARNFEHFFEVYLEALTEGYAALFAGAGLSHSSGFVDWKELLRGVATDLGLEIDKESDLIALAQYHYNDKRSRDTLSRALIHEFTKDAQVSENHRLIVEMPLKTIWTTNYDSLIEEAFKLGGKRPDVKRTVPNLQQTLPKRDVVIYKMHGDITMPEEAVLIKDDYQMYDRDREAFSTMLKGDLISKTFLFVGFSFTDPNIEYVLGRIRALFGDKQREHFCIMARPKASVPETSESRAEHEYELRKLELRIQDLKRYNITALLVDRYEELTGILAKLAQASRLRNVMISGASARVSRRLGYGRFEDLLRRVGHMLAQRKATLISGMGLDVGGSVLMSFMGDVFESDRDELSDRLILMPFPGPQRPENLELYSQYRRSLVSRAGVVIVIAGNRIERGKIVSSAGVFEEVEIARELKRFVIPIGATGYAAAEVARQMAEERSPLFTRKESSEDMQILGNPEMPNEAIVEALARVLDAIESMVEQGDVPRGEPVDRR